MVFSWFQLTYRYYLPRSIPKGQNLIRMQMEMCVCVLCVSRWRTRSTLASTHSTRWPRRTRALSAICSAGLSAASGSCGCALTLKLYSYSFSHRMYQTSRYCIPATNYLCLFRIWCKTKINNIQVKYEYSYCQGCYSVTLWRRAIPENKNWKRVNVSINKKPTTWISSQ